MHCNSCVAKVTQALRQTQGVKHATVDLETGTAKLTLDDYVSTIELNATLKNTGDYILYETHTEPSNLELPEPSLQTYRPLILIVSFIAGISLLAQYPFTDFNGMLWMRHFMAGFFMAFSFFKLINLKGFANSYAMYDIIAARWSTWGFIYPFVELALGIAYLINYDPTLTNWITIIVLGVSSIGVIESNINKRKIKCACLGDVFNLPMSTVTIVEDIGMLAMACFMLLY